MAKTGRKPPAPNPPPSYGALGRVEDEAARQTLRAALDRLSAVERRLAALEATSLQVGSPVDAYGQRIQRVQDPQAPHDAVNLQTLRRLIRSATVGRVTTARPGGGGGGGGTSPPSPPTTPGLAVWGPGFAYNGERFDWRGITLFTVFAWLCRNLSGTDTSLNWCRDNGITVPRILLSFKADFWLNQGLYLDPAEHQDYWQKLGQLLDMCFSRGLAPELVIFGDVELIYTTQGQRVAFTQAVANFLRQRNAQVFLQIANEPERIGISSTDALALAFAYNEIDPTRLLTTGPSSHGGRNVPPNDYLTWHSDRTMSPTPWEWVARQGTDATGLQRDRPAVSDEPLNAGYAAYGGWDDGTDRWWAAAVQSRLMQWSMTFHYEAGIFGAPPPPSSDALACYQAWRAGLDLLPFDIAGVGSLFGRNANDPAVVFGNVPFSGLNGARQIVGRHDGAAGRALALNVSGSWVPPMVAGWTATTIQQFGNARLMALSAV